MRSTKATRPAAEVSAHGPREIYQLWRQDRTSKLLNREPKIKTVRASPKSAPCSARGGVQRGNMARSAGSRASTLAAPTRNTSRVGRWINETVGFAALTSASTTECASRRGGVILARPDYYRDDAEFEAAAAKLRAERRANGKGAPPHNDGAPPHDGNGAEAVPAGAIVIDARAPYDVARLFRARLATPLHHHRGVFYEWDGASWPEAGADKLRARLYAFLDGCQSKTNGGFCPVRPNALMVGGVLDALRAASHLDATVAPPAWLDGADRPPAHEIVACANGLLHLPTLRLLPHTSSFFNFNSLDYAFQPNAPKPRQWLAFLDQVWPDDPELIATLQQTFGYLLTAETSHQKAFLFVGPKRSGKGTIARVMARLVGPHNYVSPTLASLGERFGQRR